MKKHLTTIAAACALACAIGSAAAAQTLIFDNSAGTNGASFRSAQSAPITYISSVTADTAISSFAILNGMGSDGDLRFVVFDEDTQALLYASAAVAYSQDQADTWKESPSLSLTLLAGHTYDIGAIADVSADYPYIYPRSTFAEGAITSAGDNQNVGNFTTPSLSGHGQADIPLRLYAPSGQVPEPGSLALLAGFLVAGSSLVVVRPRR